MRNRPLIPNHNGELGYYSCEGRSLFSSVYSSTHDMARVKPEAPIVNNSGEHIHPANRRRNKHIRMRNH
ncbi:unnamed protein product [Protopolystoma xenopodis]|uniref:Uncharacterized protein n=1 Tax=Protopolystoma xenopodis TaxID=117903 RepID=A0A448WZC6_9PLAT|nr:unnamed protein product [Protopolystoma xenopodis]